MSDSQKSSYRQTAIFVLCFFMLFLFLRNTDVCASEMKRGLSICAGILIPTLFPYMIISEILVRAGAGYYLGKIFDKSMRRLFGIRGSGAGALILGIICGFPIGAKTASALYAQGELSKEECSRLLAFCNYPSAPFVIFAVGKNLLGNVRLGILLYLVTVALGVMQGIISKEKHTEPPLRISSNLTKNQSFFKIFTESVSSAAGSLISVCASVTFFTCFVGCFSSIGFINGFPTLKTLIFSFFELTSGAAACASLTSPVLAAILCAAAVGWSGISVYMQIYSVCATTKSPPSLLPYLKSKIISSVLCALCVAAAVKISPSFLPDNIRDTNVFLDLSVIPSPFAYAANILFAVSLMIYVNKNLTEAK